MIHFRPHLGLPVLAKELIEQANRRRTYIIRFLYALMLFGICSIIFYVMMLEVRHNSLELLGQGRWMFEFLLWVQIGGIYLLLPAMLSGVIAGEKERNTLVLLLLTRLGPWEILIQKLLSRFVVIFTFILLNSPLLAVTYTFGGVSGEQLFLGMYTLLLTSLQVGAFAIMCSAFCRTTAVAFIASYIGLGLLYLLLPFMYEVLPIWLWGAYGADYNEVNALALLPMYSYLTRITGGTGLNAGSDWSLVSESIPVFLSIAIFLLAGRWYLTARAMLSPRNPVVLMFRRLDRFFGRINTKVAGGIEIIRSSRGGAGAGGGGGGGGELPDEKPVAWLERTRRAIARPHYLLRLLLVAMFPTSLLCYISFQIGTDALSLCVFIAWPVLVLWLTILAAGTFASERTGQTLHVLLTTPLSTRQIVREKVGALWRFAMVLALPLATIHFFEAWIEYRAHGVNALAYLAIAFASIVIYVSLIVWLAVWLGMWMKTQVRATITAVALLIAVCIMPFIMAVPVLLIAEFTNIRADAVWGVMLASPLIILPALELGDLLRWSPAWSPAWVFGLHFAGYAALALAIRAVCYTAADRLLGRVAPPR